MQIKEIKNKILFKNGKIFDSVLDKIYEADILVNKDKIEEIGDINPEKQYEVVNLKGKIISQGFIDIHVHFRDPGFEDAETITSGSKAALAGGFTQVCCMPNTKPAIDNEAEVRAVYRKSRELPVDVYPIAAITKGRKGEELTEMNELANAGAVAFSDDGSPVEDSVIFRNALEYAKITGKVIINHAEDLEIKGTGYMHEGIVSAQLGIEGIPGLSEELMINRDIRTAEYVDAKIHIPHVSTAESVDLIRKAKKRGVKITCEVTPHHFSLTDEYMRNFNANGKVAPPLRSEKDRVALIEGLKDGTIDVIATDHAPHLSDTKETSLDLASFGLIGLESCFGLAMTKLVHEGHLSLMDLIKKLTINPAKILGLPLSSIKVGEKANFTIVDPDEWWIFNKKNIYSKSENTPFLGQEFNGKVKAVLNKSHYMTV